MFHTAKVFQIAGLPVDSTAPLFTGNKKKQFGNTATRAPDQYPVPVGLPHPQATGAPDQYPILASLPYPSTDRWEVRKV